MRKSDAYSTEGDNVSWVTILIIVLVVLLVLGFFGRGRF
jgi:Tfp pilus assembly protein PilX